MNGYRFEAVTPDSVRVCEETFSYPLTKQAAVENLAHLVLTGPNGAPDYHKARCQFYRDALIAMAEANKGESPAANTQP